jgi:hypothetical protein
MNNPPAFPIVIDMGDGVKYQTGMTLRDYFAAKAMQGQLSRPSGGYLQEEDVAKYAYMMADAMLKAREA